MSFQLKAKESVLKSLTDGTGYHLALAISLRQFNQR
jgi:hypothetical protein